MTGKEYTQLAMRTNDGNETIEYAKQCQSNGYVIIDIQIRDFEVSE